jgi:actin-related protein
MFDSFLKVKQKDFPILISEPSLHNGPQREKLCEIMFESIGTLNFFVCKAAVLSS